MAVIVGVDVVVVFKMVICARTGDVIISRSQRVNHVIALSCLLFLAVFRLVRKRCQINVGIVRAVS